MSLNQTHGMNPEKTKHYGPLFGSIDFEMNESLSGAVIRQRRGDTTIGSLKISGHSYNVTMNELERIIETLQSARDVFYKSYTLGRY